MIDPLKDSTEQFEKALENQQHQIYILKLYIAGNTARSNAAIARIRRMCDTELAGRYELEVVDIYQHPELARKQQIVAAPTLVKQLPLPLRRIVGDLTRNERVLIGLDVQMTNSGPTMNGGG